MKRFLDFLLSRWYVDRAAFQVIVRRQELDRGYLAWTVQRMRQMENAYKLQCDEMAQKALNSLLGTELKRQNEELTTALGDKRGFDFAGGKEIQKQNITL